MKKGFTLIELLVVIGIIGILVAVAIPNFLSARQRAVDSRTKSEMAELKNALRLYYNDYAGYPGDYGGSGFASQIKGCGISGTSNCDRSVCTTVDFAAGGSGCDNLYMKQFPTGFGPQAASKSIFYYSSAGGAAGGDDFCLTSVLYNKSDPDLSTSESRCVAACGNNCAANSGKYCLCAD